MARIIWIATKVVLRRTKYKYRAVFEHVHSQTCRDGAATGQNEWLMS